METTPLAFAKTTPIVEVGDAQAWLRTRFEGLVPEDFSDNRVIVYSACNLVPPHSFHQVWWRIASHHRAGDIASAEERAQLCSAALLLVLADARDQEQMQDVARFGCFIDSLGAVQSVPFVILLLHSVAPHVRPAIEEHSRFLVVANALQNGINDAIIDEPATLKLVWAVRSRVFKSDAFFQDACEQKNKLFRQRDMLRMISSDSLWSYSRARLCCHMPKVDYQIPLGEPLKVGGLDVGDYLGEGAFSRVFKMTREGAPTGQAVKMLRKRHLASIHGIKSLEQQIEAMTVLSSQAWGHQHILRTHAIHHSRTHIFFCMEDGGSQNLFNRLYHRDMMTSPLSMAKAKVIMEQAIGATCHLHLALRFAHLDIHSKNILVSETDSNMTIKICDFDTVVVEPRGPITKDVGSHPFVAPEVVLQRSYDPFLADIWSMGVVFVEILCRKSIIDQALGLTAIPSRKRVAQQVYSFFRQRNAVELLLAQHLRPELVDMTRADVFLSGMLDVMCVRRWECRNVVQVFSDRFP